MFPVARVRPDLKAPRVAKAGGPRGRRDHKASRDLREVKAVGAQVRQVRKDHRAFRAARELVLKVPKARRGRPA